jgi:hypothetical protein
MWEKKVKDGEIRGVRVIKKAPGTSQGPKIARVLSL